MSVYIEKIELVILTETFVLPTTYQLKLDKHFLRMHLNDYHN